MKMSTAKHLGWAACRKPQAFRTSGSTAAGSLRIAIFSHLHYIGRVPRTALGLAASLNPAADDATLCSIPIVESDGV
jgi:hypothetical protein